MFRRFAIGILIGGFLVTGSWVMAQQERPDAKKATSTEVGPFVASPAGDTAVLLETKSGKTWVLTRSVDGRLMWLPASRIDSEEEAGVWLNEQHVRKLVDKEKDRVENEEKARKDSGRRAVRERATETARIEVKIVDGDRRLAAPELFVTLGTEGRICFVMDRVVGNESLRTTVPTGVFVTVTPTMHEGKLILDGRATLTELLPGSEQNTGDTAAAVTESREWNFRVRTADGDKWHSSAELRKGCRVNIRGWLQERTVYVAPAVKERTAEGPRHSENMAAMKGVMAGSESDEKKFKRLAELMRQEVNATHRRELLALAAAARPGPAAESFLIGVLQSDDSCMIRHLAARMLGRFGSEAAIAPLAKTAATDVMTVGLSGCLHYDGVIRREAMFALAELGRRLPTSAKAVTEELRKLPETSDADKGLVNEELGDARRQALFQVTRNRSLLAPFFEQLRSKDAKIRSKGVIAFQFLALTEAPGELVTLARDPSEEVRSWVALVLGEIGDSKTVPLLMALAKDTNMDYGTRCNAIGSLGRMRATDAQSLLESLLSDQSVRSIAAMALSQITGKRHPLVPQGFGGPDWPGSLPNESGNHQ